VKILQFHLDDLIVDYEGVASAIERACARGSWRVMGVCQIHSHVIVPLEPAAAEERREYVLAPFSGTSQEEVTGDIFSRWQGGFSTRGLIRLEAVTLGLFERPAPG